MTKQDIIDYVVKTPHNTNKAVLGSMLDQMSGGSSGGSDISVVAIPVTHIVPDGSVFQNAYGDLHVTLNNTDYKTADGAAFDDTLYAVVVDGYCKLDNMVCYVDSGYCIPSGVVATGSVSWDANTISATIIGEGTMTITWEYAD